MAIWINWIWKRVHNAHQWIWISFRKLDKIISIHRFFCHQCWMLSAQYLDYSAMNFFNIFFRWKKWVFLWSGNRKRNAWTRRRKKNKYFQNHSKDLSYLKFHGDEVHFSGTIPSGKTQLSQKKFVAFVFISPTLKYFHGTERWTLNHKNKAQILCSKVKSNKNLKNRRKKKQMETKRRNCKQQ